MLRPTGHRSPRRRNASTPVAYRPAASTRKVSAKPSGTQPNSIRAAVGGPGSGNPSSSPAGDGRAPPPTGVGVRDRPTASATVAAITTSSVAATDTNCRIAGPPPAATAATVLRRCHQPNPPSTHSAATFASTSPPYAEDSSGATPPSRTPALTTPDTATAAKHHAAKVENLGTASRRPSAAPATTATHVKAASPPTHSDAAARCASRLATASSWLPDEA